MAKKQLEDSEKAAADAIKLKQDKEEALKKLQAKTADEEDANYKKLIDTIPKASMLAEQTSDQVYDIAANIIETELVGRKQVIRMEN